MDGERSNAETNYTSESIIGVDQRNFGVDQLQYRPLSIGF